jgi:hypothetical protein
VSGRISIIGIETSAGLDPDDPTAFMTGLDFVAQGTTDVTMLARRQFVPDQVPLPGTLALALIGGIGLGFGLRRRRTQVGR